MHYGLIATYELVVVFGFSAFMKSLSVGSFVETMRQLQLGRYSKALALFIIGLEWLAAIMLIAESTRWCGQAVVGILLLSFGWALWRAKVLNRQVQCSCFGQGSQQFLGRGTIVRILLLALLLGLSLSGLGQESEPLSWIDRLLSALIAGGIFAIVWLSNVVRTEFKAGNVMNRREEVS
ncbi:MauE/DoxX family redox-associated membrane protein [Paenibacillus xylaniclasticus]|uniref:MauE/DoxX family redox-associated membrane protein n=1 Tax=Paenibacillus xylaniclasticus TaxID=588083 RepID=UPI000FDB4807|nr:MULTISPECIES: MauE/DoxX family redox-associated membrane protein [Paenibacillus]GFN33320.1 hypothetical protein PCURB6_35800 [Paenibacillus curdlanolyticus]